MFYHKLLLGSSLFFSLLVSAQVIKPGFDKEEYRQLMLISARTTAVDSYSHEFETPKAYQMIYRSAVIGLDNLWDLWTAPNNTAVISIRGTTPKAESWLNNFYAAMVPAKGQIQVNDKEVFNYQLAANPKAAVHVGWLLSTAYLSKDILPHIKELYNKGTKEFYIMGHSQGGAIAYLITSYVYNLQKLGELPADIRFKTYCSAGPKPGNLYYAYEYEAMVQGGWAYNVVNAADWVPEVPFSIQTTDDFNLPNPFAGAKDIIKKQGTINRIALRYAYNQLDKPTRKAQRNFQKYLGGMTGKMVAKQIPGFKAPDYYNSNHYVRTGPTIVLLPDDAYYKIYNSDTPNVFVHHLHKPYLMLLDKLPADAGTTTGMVTGLMCSPSKIDISAAAARTKPFVAKRMVIHSAFGFQTPQFNNLNQQLSAAGFMKFNKTYFTRGAGFFTVFPQIRLATLLNYQTYTSTKSEGSMENSLRGTTVGTSLGFSLLRSSTTFIIPFAGVSYSWFGARISKTQSTPQSLNSYLTGTANQQHIAYNGFVSNVGLHLSFMPFINKNIGKNTVMGFKAGYFGTLGNPSWKTNNTKLDGGPKTNTQGFYANFVLGTAL
ncbi:MAG: lipase family protein [Chitinophagaceae bacterium]